MLVRLALLLVTLLLIAVVFNWMMAALFWRLSTLLVGFAAGFLIACIIFLRR